MMSTDCSIVEDLLPLYTEGLLQEETTIWLEEHLKNCSNCSKLAKISSEPMTHEPIPTAINTEKMLAKINIKLSIYQIIFVGLSFFLAIRTTLLNQSFGFILSYTLLGLLTYLFYKNIKIVIAISFLPVFIWSNWELFLNFQEIVKSAQRGSLLDFLQILMGLFMIATIHLAFALIGAAIGALILKIKESEV